MSESVVEAARRVAFAFGGKHARSAYTERWDEVLPQHESLHALDAALAELDAEPTGRPCPIFGEARWTSECEKCGGEIINCPVYGPGEKRRRDEQAAA